MQPLKELIGDAQIVQLGEQSHGDGTCFETKIRLIKFLHQEMGFDVLAFESGLFDCRKAWQSLKQGDDPRKAVTKGVFGIWTGSRQTQELWDYLGENVETDSPLELAGFDCQLTASGSRDSLVEDLLEFCANRQLKSVTEDELDLIDEQLTLLIDGADVSKIDGFDASIDKLISELSAIDSPDEVTKFWTQNLKSLRALVQYRTDKKKPVMDMRRDAQMAKNLIWMNQKQYKGRKIIVWAASFHIMRNAKVIEGPIDYSNLEPMGTGVHEALGDRVFTIGFTTYEGRAGAYFRKKFDLMKARRGSLESVFVEAGIENGVVTLNPKDEDGKWLREKIRSRPLGYSWMKAKWGDHFDAMAFNRTMSPSTSR